MLHFGGFAAANPWDRRVAEVLAYQPDARGLVKIHGTSGFLFQRIYLFKGGGYEDQNELGGKNEKLN